MQAKNQNRSATYADLEALPADQMGQIVGGSLYASPRPPVSHTHATSALMGHVVGPFHLGMGGPGGWKILFRTALHLGGDVLVPDIAGWRLARWPSRLEGNGIAVAPDWVCDVLAPTTEVTERITKMAAYRRAGVAYRWLVNPVLHFVEIYEQTNGFWTRLDAVGGVDDLCAAPFDAITIPLAKIWLHPPTPDPSPTEDP